uniref:hypothetical protein n=1 Tax=Klebsiella aerogenes TaxID=548 RepID=UPI0019532ADF
RSPCRGRLAARSGGNNEMTENTGLTAMTATEAVKVLVKGEATPLEFVDAAIARIEACDGAVNALPTRFF